MKAKLLQDLAKYPLCWFFLRKCVEDMSDRQITADLAAEPDMSLLQHFDTVWNNYSPERWRPLVSRRKI